MATEIHGEGSPDDVADDVSWTFPVIEAAGPFLVDPADLGVEADAVVSRAPSDRYA